MLILHIDAAVLHWSTAAASVIADTMSHGR